MACERAAGVLAIVRVPLHAGGAKSRPAVMIRPSRPGWADVLNLTTRSDTRWHTVLVPDHLTHVAGLRVHRSRLHTQITTVPMTVIDPRHQLPAEVLDWMTENVPWLEAGWHLTTKAAK